MSGTTSDGSHDVTMFFVPFFSVKTPSSPDKTAATAPSTLVSLAAASLQVTYAISALSSSVVFAAITYGFPPSRKDPDWFFNTSAHLKCFRVKLLKTDVRDFKELYTKFVFLDFRTNTLLCTELAAL